MNTLSSNRILTSVQISGKQCPSPRLTIPFPHNAWYCTTNRLHLTQPTLTTLEVADLITVEQKVLGYEITLGTVWSPVDLHGCITCLVWQNSSNFSHQTQTGHINPPRSSCVCLQRVFQNTLFSMNTRTNCICLEEGVYLLMLKGGNKGHAVSQENSKGSLSNYSNSS